MRECSNGMFNSIFNSISRPEPGLIVKVENHWDFVGELFQGEGFLQEVAINVDYLSDLTPLVQGSLKRTRV
jgi:hypothetical protein